MLGFGDLKNSISHYPIKGANLFQRNAAMRPGFFFFCFLFPLLLFAQRRSGSALLQFRKGVSIEEAGRLLAARLPEAKAKLRVSARASAKRGIYRLEWDEEALPFGKLKQVLAAQTEVLAWQPDYRIHFREKEPDDPLFASQWNLALIRAAEMWDVTTGGLTAAGDTIVVAVIDNGFDIAHEDLQSQLWTNWQEALGLPGVDDDANGYIDDLHGWDFNNDGPDYQVMSHGTSVAGIIGARGDNNTDVAGINWNIQLMLFGAQYTNDIVDAYYYILDQRRKYNQSGGAEGAFVVSTNASFGIEETWCDAFPLWGAVYDSLGAEGVLSISAVTNNKVNVGLVGDIPTTCPSDYLITTTNTDAQDQLLAGFGLPYVDLSAPSGVGSDGLPALKPGNESGHFGGTSGACPQVTAAVALLYSLPSEKLMQELKENPSEGALLLKEALLHTTTLLSDLQDRAVSGGRLDLYNSFLYLHARAQELNRADALQTFTGQTAWIVLFPNPVPVGLKLEAWFGSENLAPVFIRLTDLAGRMIFDLEVKPQPFEQQHFLLPTQNLPRGSYVLTLRQGAFRQTKKIVVF